MSLAKLLTDRELLFKLNTIVLVEEYGWTLKEVTRFERLFDARLKLYVEELLARYKEEAATWNPDLVTKHKEPLNYHDATAYLKATYLGGRNETVTSINKDYRSTS